jgi:hypothetical protein
MTATLFLLFGKLLVFYKAGGDKTVPFLPILR